MHHNSNPEWIYELWYAPINLAFLKCSHFFPTLTPPITNSHVLLLECIRMLNYLGLDVKIGVLDAYARYT
jgi:hypothetical protein